MCKAHDVPSERPATAVPDRLSVGFDATPLLGRPTGVGVFCAGALEGLAGRDDVAVSAFAVSWRRRREIDGLVPAGVGTDQRPMPARPLHSAWARFHGPPLEWFVPGVDVVHGSNFVVPPTRRAARVVTVHDLTVSRYPELCDAPTLAFPGLIRRAVADGAWVHTPSEFVAAEVVAELGVDPARVRWVHHGVPHLPGAAPTDAGDDSGGNGLGGDDSGGNDLGAAPGDGAAAGGAAAPGGVGGPGVALPAGCGRYVLAVGTIEPRKDYPLLLRSFAAVAAVHRDTALVIVGGDGWGSDRFADALAASPVRDRVVRTGYLGDAALAATLRGAAVLAYPSKYEGFGFPPLQAMAARVPVVATAAGAVPEVVGDGAWLVDPGDEAGLSAQLVRALDGGPEVDELTTRGLARSAMFSWPRCAAGLAGLYRDAMADRASSSPTAVR
jgi:glycosyltransferase involved in cell wall biosynthesis